MASAPAAETVRLYVANPGIRNYVQYGGVGVLILDASHDYRVIKRLPTWPVLPRQDAENVKGISANARTGLLYVSSLTHLICIDLLTEQPRWSRAFPGGCDRMALSPDGRILYVPAMENTWWTVVNALTGEVIKQLSYGIGSHNTIYADDGTEVYLAALHWKYLGVADPATHTVVRTVGPFSNFIRPFTVNGNKTLCFVNVDGLLGFEIGDLRTGKVLAHVAALGATGTPKRHGCPSHGIALSPDEREIWLADGVNNKIHIYDATIMPPKWVRALPTTDLPGWITFSIDGRRVYVSDGEVFDAQTKTLVATLKDEKEHPLQSEKLVEVAFENGRPVLAGSSFGIGKVAVRPD